MFGIIGSVYGFMMKAEGSATSMLKLIFSLGGGGSLMAAVVMQSQINKSNLLDDNDIGFFRAFGVSGRSSDRRDKTSY